MINREAIYNALLAQLATSAAFLTVSRKPLTPDQLTPDMQPCLMLEEVKETAEPRPRGLPAKWTLDVDLGIYYYFESQPETPGVYDPSPSTMLNNLIGAVEAALAPDPATGLQTLGGLVSHCWIEGEVVKSPAYLQGQGAAIVPVKIMAVAGVYAPSSSGGGAALPAVMTWHAPVNAPDGHTTAFNFTGLPSQAAQIIVILNGLVQTSPGDYGIAGGALVMTDPPAAGASLSAYY
jgi:hypothetical protein